LSISAQAENNSAFTDFETITDVLFPPTKLQESHRRPTTGESQALEIARAGALSLIETTGPAWFQSIVAPDVPTRAGFRDAIETLKRAPIWICRADECTGCRGDKGIQGCAQGKMLGEGVGIVLSINPCLLRASAQCRSIPGLPSAPSSHGLIEHFTSILGGAAYFKAQGVTDAKARELAVRRATATLSKTMSSARSIASACPGPFPLSGVSFLRQTGHLREIGPFAEQCGERMLQPFKRSPLPDSCKYVVDQARFKKTMSEGLLWGSPSVVRCDSFCEALTCGERTPEVPRALQFGNKWILSVPEGACEGAQPTKLLPFLERVLRIVAKPEILKKETAARSIALCASALMPTDQGIKSPTSEAVPVQLPDGPDIQLID